MPAILILLPNLQNTEMHGGIYWIDAVHNMLPLTLKVVIKVSEAVTFFYSHVLWDNKLLLLTKQFFTVVVLFSQENALEKKKRIKYDYCHSRGGWQFGDRMCVKYFKWRWWWFEGRGHENWLSCVRMRTMMMVNLDGDAGRWRWWRWQRWWWWWWWSVKSI